ncbi:MAG: signal recognition particle-docking protein FtsY [Rhizobiaceae bacterium]
MAEKKEGFFKRLFRFGKAKREDEVEEQEQATAEALAAEAAEAEAKAEQEAKDAAAREAEEAERQAEAQRKADEAAAQAEQQAKEDAERAAEEAAQKAAAAELAAQEQAERETAEQEAAAREAEREAQARAEAANKAQADEAARLASAEAQSKAEAQAKAEQEATEEAERQAAADREAATAKAAEEDARKAAQAAAKAEAEAEQEAKKQAEHQAAIERDAAKAAEEEAAAAAIAAEAEQTAEETRLEQERIDAEAAAKAAAEPEPVAEEPSSPSILPPPSSDSPPPPPPPPSEPEKKSWFSRLKDGLARSSSQLTENITAVFTKRKLDEDTLQELEDILIQADLGVETALNITDKLASQRLGKDITDEEVREFMAGEIEQVLEPVAAELELDLDHAPHVILVVGVNGSGKTTTIGKLSQKLVDGGFSTMLVAGDTFRAAAIEQLKIWGDRTGSQVVSRPLGSDAAGLAFDAYAEAKAAGNDVVLMDTAGRLQNKTELMDELEKIIRVLRKQDPTAPHTVLLTLDATTGQNALNQVEIFKDVAGVNGLVMTKLDGTARGGIMVSIAAKFKLPVFFIGVGEQVEDLEPFDAKDFARSIAGLDQ